ncbi:Dihydropteroate synthase [Desulfuromusa kysingii]|uniref:Dihydropteroate synthase n=1 Tax=Desulfuromusa kysingii TaxID=37625 RepID=A0A1H3WXJ4_9BACT|nr:dihydropteroate synthase [Desulfuromusa kysingii]SDZ91907.1 Dihydropteroate synthase [Desulfuromusa kysingii]
MFGRNCHLDLSRPCIMGILNVTPDSFSDGGQFLNTDVAVQQGLMMQQEGAAILDIGGESTKPGSLPVSADEELARVLPVIKALRNRTDLPLSIDTNKALVAREAVSCGVDFINDISGLTFDPEMATVAAETGAGLFLMHTSGRPELMQQLTAYSDLLAEVIEGLSKSVDLALQAGIAADRIAIDPGIGFGKTAVGNVELLHHVDKFNSLGYPVLLGTSRKSFIGRILNQDNPQERLFGTLATIVSAVAAGVQIFRVHDVRPAQEAALVAWAIREQRLP